MAQVTTELIEEGRKLGNVPGALVNNHHADSFPNFILPPYDEWDLKPTGAINASQRTLRTNTGSWCTVITPAPVVKEEGLKEGDACQCGPAMRAAIVELAEELGVRVTSAYAPGEGGINNVRWDGRCLVRARIDGTQNWITPEAFIAKMRITAAKPKPIKIGNNVVKFNTGSITVGCTTIQNATVKAIAEKLID